MTDDSFRQAAKKELLEWAQNRKLDIGYSTEPFGEVISFNGALSLVIDPRASSSQELRDAQAEARSAGRVLYFLYPWDGELRKLLSHFESKLQLDSRKFAAKRLKLSTIANPVADRFMVDFHIQGSTRGTDKVSLALVDPATDEILAVQQFSRFRFSGSRGTGSVKNSPVWEGLRLCFRPGVQIHGGATRMQKFFEENWKPERIVSYVSASHSTGAYKALQGFELVSSPRSDAYQWVLVGDPKPIEIIDKNGAPRVPDLDKCLENPWINPARIAGAFGKGVGETLFGGRLGSRTELRAHPENGSLVHNDVILEAIGYEKRWTPGQYRWEKNLTS